MSKEFLEDDQRQEAKRLEEEQLDIYELEKLRAECFQNDLPEAWANYEKKLKQSNYAECSYCGELFLKEELLSAYKNVCEDCFNLYDEDEDDFDDNFDPEYDYEYEEDFE